MGVRFILGRAGSGKTFHCVESIRSELASNPNGAGRLILLVPEQASLQMERALLRQPGPGAIHRAEVLSFRRLAYRILQTPSYTSALGSFGEKNPLPDGRGSFQNVNDTSTHISISLDTPLLPSVETSQGGALNPAIDRFPHTVLTETGRVMTLRHLLGRMQDQLTYYRRSGRSPGFWKTLSDAIGELLDEGVSPADLGEAAAATGDSLQARRLEDLAVIYQAYVEQLGRHRADPRELLSIAAKGIASCEWLAGCRVWMDGFAGLTRQEASAAVALARVAVGMDITVMCDPGVVTCGLRPEALFFRTAQTYQELREALVQGGTDIEAPLILEPSPLRRFARSAPLAELECKLFQPTDANGTTTDASPQLFPKPSLDGGASRVIELVRMPDQWVEVEYAIAKVMEWVSTGERPLRYRDIAIIARDLGCYHTLLSSALGEHDIPFFIDRRRSTAHHPVVELLRGLISLIEDDFSREAVFLLLKTGLIVEEGPASQALENYLLATGISGAKWWCGPKWVMQRSDRLRLEDDREDTGEFDLEQIDGVRGELLRRTETFRRLAADGAKLTGRQWAAGLASAIDELDVAGRLQQWAKESEDDGDLDQAEEHRQIIRDTAALLGDLDQSLGDEVLELHELHQALEAGLAHFTLGLAPPMLDQVLVGSIERSRHPDLRGVILVGFNDGQFPSVPAESPVLLDEDRGLLEHRQRRVGRRRQRELLDDRLLFYTAVTRPSERLIITCPRQDAGGQTLAESPYVPDLLMACRHIVQIDLPAPQQVRATWSLHNGNDVAGALAQEFSTRLPLEQDDAGRRAVWNGIYERTRQHRELKGRVGQALQALVFENRARLNMEDGGSPSGPAPGEQDIKRRGPALRASVSELETFAACPFKHFSQYRLRLRERRLAELEQVDVGRLHHAVLEKFVKRALKAEAALSNMDNAEIASMLAASCEDVKLDALATDELSGARDRYLIRRSAQELQAVLALQSRMLRGGQFRPLAAEQRFGFDDDAASWPGLLVTTPKGRTVLLRGVIDRVDLAELTDESLGVVVDYKRYKGEKPRVQLSKVYHGLSLQLLGYLLVLVEQGHTLAGRPLAPAGALYVPLREGYQSVDHPSDAQPAERVRGLSSAPRGLIHAKHATALDAAAGSGPSNFFQVSLKAGTVSDVNRSDAAPADAFDRLLAHTQFKLGELADGVIDGCIDISPYRQGRFSPCAWCTFNDLCRFEFGQPGLRFLDQLTRSDVFTRLTSDDRNNPRRPERPPA